MAHFIATPDGVYEAGELIRRVERLTALLRRVGARADLDAVTRLELDAALAGYKIAEEVRRRAGRQGR